MEELDLFGNIINQPQEHNRGIQYSQQDFITKANNVHNYKYDYSETKYVNSYTKIKIKCPMHGYFCWHVLPEKLIFEKLELIQEPYI